MVAQTDAGRGSAPERGDQASDARPTGSVCACDLRAVLRPPFGTMPPNTPRAAGRGAAGADARRRHWLKCYARRDSGPPLGRGMLLRIDSGIE